MNLPTVKVIYDRRKTTAKQGGKGLVEIEIYYNRKRKWVSTGVSISPNQWSEDLRVVSHPDSFLLNSQIDASKKRINDYISKLIIENNTFSFDRFSEYLNATKNDGDFIQFVEDSINARKDISNGTRRNHMKIVSALESFGRIRSFKDLSRTKILEFDAWLHSKNYVQTTIHSYHKFLKVYIHSAMLRGIIDADPYFGVRIEEGKSKQRKYLTDEELAKIQNCEGMTHSLEKVRDMFLFQCYTGLAYADMASFDASSIVMRDGRHIYHNQRVKSDEDYYIVIIPQAYSILEKYEFSLPVMSNEQYNMRLKAVADWAGVEKRITSHMARHTFAVNSLNSGIPIEVVSKMLGHTNTNTTQIYAKVVNKTVDSAFDRIQDKFSNNG